MTKAELHTALREVVAIGRRGGYDNDEIAEKLGRVVRDFAAARLRAVADELADALAVDGWIDGDALTAVRTLNVHADELGGVR